MPFPGKQRSFFAGAVLFLVSFIVYIPALRAGFVWDDDAFLWNNPLILSASGLRDFWLSTKPPDYFPLTSSMLWLEWRLFGAQHPWGYHAVNVLLHAASSVLLWRLLRALAIPGAWLAALLFAVHPVNVEAVAWITQRKSTLPMVFALLSALLFFRSREAVPGGSLQALLRTPRYWLALLCFLLALLAKTSVVLLPVVFLLLAWWRESALTRRDILAALPFFAVAGALSLVTIWFQYNVAIGEDIVRDDGFLSRLAIAGRALWFYLYKALLPLTLIFVYPRWEIPAANPAAFLPLALFVVLLFVLWRLRARSWARATLTALLVFAAMLFPVLGFFNIYFMRYSLVADHYQYAAIPALIALVTAFAVEAARRLPGPAVRRGIAALVVLALAVLSWRQAGLYHDDETLLQATLEKNPGAWMAHYNLGIALKKSGRADEAIASYRRAVAIRPNHAKAYSNLGAVHYEKGQIDDAIDAFRKSLEIRPDSALDHSNLGTALADAGQLEQALAHLRMALTLDPEYADAHYNLGNALLQAGKIREAIARFERALELKSDYPAARYNLANTLLRAGRLDDAIAQYGLTLESEPGHVEARNNLGLALLQQGRVSEAAGHFRIVLESRPGDAGALSSLAWILATGPDASARDGAQALSLASEANRLSGGANPGILHTLAAAYAEAGRFPEAVETARRALDIATDDGNAALAGMIERELSLYEAGSPLRDARALQD